MASEHQDPPYAENLTDRRIPVAPTYRGEFDPRLEKDDWEYHRTIRQDGASAARNRLYAHSAPEGHYELSGGDGILQVHPQGGTQPKPYIFFIHGGLMTGSDRFVGVDKMVLDWGKDPLSDVIVHSVEYGRPPQSRGHGPSDDCWEFFCNVWENHKTLNIDPKNVIVYGASAGGCLAASMILRWVAAHGRNPDLANDPLFSEIMKSNNPPFPDLKGVYLEAPMLDDRHQTISRRQYAKGGADVGGNLTSTELGFSWGWLLNWYEKIEKGKPLKVIKRRVGTNDVSILEVPGRATAAQLKGFPPVCLEVGDADPLRDEGKNFIDQVKASGGDNEAEYKLCQGGVPHGGWAIDVEKKEKATRDLLSARVQKLKGWLP